MPVPDFVLAADDARCGQAELLAAGRHRGGRRDEDVLLVRRSDNGQWAPITGIVEPGEDPGVAAARETWEETRVRASVDRLAMVSVTRRSSTSTATGRSTSTDDVRLHLARGRGARSATTSRWRCGWWPRDQLPPMKAETGRDVIEAACSTRPERARFRA